MCSNMFDYHIMIKHRHAAYIAMYNLPSILKHCFFKLCSHHSYLAITFIFLHHQPGNLFAFSIPVLLMLTTSIPPSTPSIQPVEVEETDDGDGDGDDDSWDKNWGSYDVTPIKSTHKVRRACSCKKVEAPLFHT